MELGVLDHFWNNGQPQPVVTSSVPGDVYVPVYGIIFMGTQVCACSYLYFSRILVEVDFM